MFEGVVREIEVYTQVDTFVVEYVRSMVVNSDIDLCGGESIIACDTSCRLSD